LRRQNDIEFKILSLSRTRIYSCLKSKKNNSCSELLGCSIQEFMDWLEFQFDENMNWDNHGTYWHMDHVKPCASFNMLSDKEQKQCFNWKNVQPLEKNTNLVKSDKIDENMLLIQKLKVNNFLAIKVNLK
jgi:hypothetical protein